MRLPIRPASSGRPRTPAPVSGRILGPVLVGLVALAIVGTVVLQVEKQPERSPVGRGEALAQSAGCFACHGRGDGEARVNLRRTGDNWTAKSNPTFWDAGINQRAELVEWITNGVTASHAERHKKLFIQMPAYQARLKPDEIDAIAAWILAEGIKLTQAPNLKKPFALPEKLPTEANARFVLGDRLARRHGCYQCHGELGQGGVTNPASFKGYIAGFFGDDLLELTNHGDRAEIQHWIDHGRGRAVEAGPLGRVAKHFLDRQAIPMPGYRDVLTPAEKEVLTDFVLQLHAKGPLPAAEIEHIFALLDHDSP